MSLKSNIIKLIPERVFGAMRVLKRPEYYLPLNGIQYRQDGLVTQHSADFMKDERFARSYALGEATNSWNGWPTHWRSHVACWAADRAVKLEGDFVECGVNKGAISRMVMEYIDFKSMQDRKFYLIDTYEGIVEEQLTEEEKKSPRKKYLPSYEEVKKTFESFPNAVIVKGMIPDILPHVTPEKVCFLSIDMNVAEPEIAAAEYFWGRLVTGAAIILDDYGWLGHEEQRRAFDEFARKHDVPLLCLPTGQGLILKQ